MNLQIQKAVSILRDGGIVAYPTDTVYGLGANIFNEQAVKRIYHIKHRPVHQPLSILIADFSDLSYMTGSLTEAGRLLSERFWPGGLTLIVKKLSTVPDWVTAEGDTVAVRVPDHHITIELIRELGRPLIGTSANFSGMPSAKTADEVRGQLGDSVDFILDGGICSGGIESTVVDVTSNIPVILREGAVPSEEVLSFCR